MDFQPGVPKKVQVADDLRRRIGSGEWKVGDSIGDLHKLAAEYGVSFGTVRAAQDILVEEGLIHQPQIGMRTRIKAIPTGNDTLHRLKDLHRELGLIIATMERVRA